MKTLGILGGMGPMATSALYERIIRHTAASSDQEHINTIILSDTTIPDRTSAIISGNTREVRKSLISAAGRLDAMGADIIIMSCNTAHTFIDELRASVKAEFLDMVELAAADAMSMCPPDSHNIGIMATDGILSSGIYASRITALGGNPIIPGSEAQSHVMSIIYDDIKAGKPGDEASFDLVRRDLAGRADAVILGCTELSVYKDLHSVPAGYIDAMDSLVRAAIEACGAQYKD